MTVVTQPVSIPSVTLPRVRNPFRREAVESTSGIVARHMASATPLSDVALKASIANWLAATA